MTIKSLENLIELLDELDSIRFSNEEEKIRRFNEIISILAENGVYNKTPAMIKYNYDFSTMVSSYGARWFEYESPHKCKNCGSDLRDHSTGPPFKREIGEYSYDLDRTIRVVCPDCRLLIY